VVADAVVVVEDLLHGKSFFVVVVVVVGVVDVVVVVGVVGVVGVVVVGDELPVDEVALV